MCLKEIDQSFITILDSIVNVTGAPIGSSKKKENLYFGNEQDIHMNSKNYEKNGYSLDLHISSYSCV